MAVVIAHAAVVYAASTLAPTVRQGVADRPVTVRFISPSPPSERQWIPKEPRAPEFTPTTPAPLLPRLEQTVETPPASHAVTALHSAIDPVGAPAEDLPSPRLVSAVEYVREPAPRYPPQSRRLREQGVVVLKVEIDERGRACDIEVATSSGYVRLDRAAREAVAGAAFRPHLENGTPRRALVLIPIEFFLNRGTA